MDKIVVTALALLLCFDIAHGQEWRASPTRLNTRWTATVSPANVLPEYPRPQMVRTNWTNLNGLWDYAITATGSVAPSRFDGKILVPFPVESALSGVQKQLRNGQLLWYRRTLNLQPKADGSRTLLHFDAVDYQATVYVNGREVGSHAGGYEAFSIDISDALVVGDNTLLVRVLDPGAAGPNPSGKQHRAFPAASGIWQTVWLEAVPATYIEKLVMVPDVDRGELRLRVQLRGAPAGHSIHASVMNGASIVDERPVSDLTVLNISHARLWSPDDPFLYDLKVRLLKDGRLVDEVTSYFGMRKVEIRRDAKGAERIFLNNRYTFNLGILDHGYWPDGSYTAPTDDALRFDVQAIKAMGFNTIRKHMKIEPARWYYHCDKLGMLVWQDMINPPNASAEARKLFEDGVGTTIAQLHNHPSIVAWVLFNENWGAYDQEKLARWTKSLDPTRLLDGHSGPFDRLNMARMRRDMEPGELIAKQSDMKSLNALSMPFMDPRPQNWAGADLTDWHHYSDPKIPPGLPSKARVAGEFGGIAAYVEGHTWDGVPGHGQARAPLNQLAQAYEAFVDELKALEAQGLSGSVFTQAHDVGWEQSGLMTYDRAVLKIPVAEIARINGKLLHADPNHTAAEPLPIQNADFTPEPERYAAMLARYSAGDREPTFLRNFAVLAISQNDQQSATAAGNEFIARSPQPYSDQVWAFINAITRTSQDRGFDLLRREIEQDHEIKGTDVIVSPAQNINEIIRREEIEPRLAASDVAIDWPGLTKYLEGKYGFLGADAARGAAMLYFLKKQDWENFGTYYSLYYSSALARSSYPSQPLAYRVLRHVDDPAVLQVAATVMKQFIDGSRWGYLGADAIAVDTYANLLFKLGQKEQALVWQTQAVEISEGRDPQIIRNLERMQSLKST